MAEDTGRSGSFGWVSLLASVGALIAAGFTLYQAMEKYVELRNDIKEIEVVAKQAELQNRIFGLAKEEAALEHRKMEFERVRLKEREEALARGEEALQRKREELARIWSSLPAKASAEDCRRALAEFGQPPGFTAPPQGPSVSPENRKKAEIVIAEPANRDRILGSAVSVTGWVKSAHGEPKVALLLRAKDKKWIVKDLPPVEQNGLWLGTIKLKEVQPLTETIIKAVLIKDAKDYRIDQEAPTDNEAPQHSVSVVLMP